VRRGDTLWSIAQRTYGDGKRWRDIAAANPGIEPTRLKVGQTLVLP
jgi:nucleoid-associated protein YgaU